MCLARRESESQATAGAFDAGFFSRDQRPHKRKRIERLSKVSKSLVTRIETGLAKNRRAASPARLDVIPRVVAILQIRQAGATSTGKRKIEIAGMSEIPTEAPPRPRPHKTPANNGE